MPLPRTAGMGAPHVGALAHVLERSDGQLLVGGRDEDPLAKMTQEQAAIDDLNDLLAVHGEIVALAEAEQLGILVSGFCDEDAELLAAFAGRGAA